MESSALKNINTMKKLNLLNLMKSNFRRVNWKKEIISKYGRSITVHHKRRIQYKKAIFYLGNNITFLEEVRTRYRLKSKSSNKLG